MDQVVPAPGDIQATQLFVASRLVLDWETRLLFRDTYLFNFACLDGANEAPSNCEQRSQFIETLRFLSDLWYLILDIKISVIF